MQKASAITLFTDLDDTLIQTRQKVPAAAQVHLGATDRTGKPLSYFTDAQQQLLQVFTAAKATIIPVTGRNSEALHRVQWAFDNFKIVSHGAVVLTHTNALCLDWLSSIEHELRDWPDLLQRANKEVLRIIACYQLDARSRVIIDQDVPAYVSIKGDAQALKRIQNENSLDKQFSRHENGRNHALLPPYTRKKRAVQHVMSQLGIDQNDLTIGLGDSVTDLPFMQACQFSMLPSGSQIAQEKLNNVYP